ncbi:MAG: EamA family transporter [Sulfolobaceae archaeon]
MKLKKGITDLFISSFLWGTIGVAVQIGYGEGANPFQMVMIRSLVSSILILPLIKIRRIIDFPSILLGIIAVTFYETYIYTINYLGASLSAVFLYTAPLWVLLYSLISKSEEINIRKIAASFSVFLGVYLMYLSNITLKDLYLGLASGITYALLIIQSRRLQLRRMTNTEIIASQSLWSFPFSLIFLFFNSFDLTIASIYTGVYLALFATLLPYYFFYKGMGKSDSITATVISTLEPVFTIFLAFVILHQVLTFLQVLGSLVIIVSAILISF